MTFEPRDAVYLPNALPKPRKRKEKERKRNRNRKDKKRKKKKEKEKGKKAPCLTKNDDGGGTEQTILYLGVG